MGILFALGHGAYSLNLYILLLKNRCNVMVDYFLSGLIKFSETEHVLRLFFIPPYHLGSIYFFFIQFYLSKEEVHTV